MAQVKKDEIRIAILRSAEAQFRQRGYGGATLRAIAKGADVNARAEIAEGFGGHTPLFHTTVTFWTMAGDSLARLLLRSGADPNLRATFRWPCHTSRGDGSPREYHGVTAIGFANRFQDPDYVNEAAVKAIREHGG